MGRKPSDLSSLCAAAASSQQRMAGPSQPLQGAAENCACEIKVVEVDAFSSVHDMIHAAIESKGMTATLRQVYKTCEERGRIAYKRAGGSRLITHNEHWKSQIRHALYTCDRFQRAAGPDLWMISPAFRHVRPQTTKVLVRSDPQAGSISDESHRNQRRSTQIAIAPRRTSRIRAPAEQDSSFLAAPAKRKRTSRQAVGQATPPTKKAAKGLVTMATEQLDECSHIDHLTAHSLQARGSTPPCNDMDCTVAPSPMTRLGASDQNAWQRAARQLNATLNGFSASVDKSDKFDTHQTGSEDDPEPGGRARSAEAESPASTQQLYALRSRSKPPPGFGDNPDPAAERAAREARAKTTGPLKKRLKAAAKAAEMAMTAASAVNEEATSTRTETTGLHCVATPSAADTSCTTGRLPMQWRPVLSAPHPQLRSRGRTGSMSLLRQVVAKPTHGAHLASLSSYAEDVDEHSTTPQPMTPSEAPSHTAFLRLGAKQVAGRGESPAFPPTNDAQEGADETDEGGSKRLLRSQAAAAAADLKRDSTLDRTGCWL